MSQLKIKLEQYNKANPIGERKTLKSIGLNLIKKRESDTDEKYYIRVANHMRQIVSTGRMSKSDAELIARELNCKPEDLI